MHWLLLNFLHVLLAFLRLHVVEQTHDYCRCWFISAINLVKKLSTKWTVSVKVELMGKGSNC